MRSRRSCARAGSAVRPRRSGVGRCASSPGHAQGRRLAAPDLARASADADKLRETLFNVLPARAWRRWRARRVQGPGVASTRPRASHVTFVGSDTRAPRHPANGFLRLKENYAIIRWILRRARPTAGPAGSKWVRYHLLDPPYGPDQMRSALATAAGFAPPRRGLSSTRGHAPPAAGSCGTRIIVAHGLAFYRST
jgi:16S rRNA G966 N2-methylase RsmD